MDLYKLQKNFYIKFKSFSYNKPGISKKFSQIVFSTSTVHVNETSAVRCFKMSAVRVSEISAALSAVSVRELSTFLKCLFFLQSVCFGFFLGRPTFPVFRFSSPASNRTVFVLILSPVLGLANVLLGGSNVVLGCGG